MDARVMRGVAGEQPSGRLDPVDTRHPHVLVLTTFDLDEYVYDALRAGAGGFMLKDEPRALRWLAPG